MTKDPCTIKLPNGGSPAEFRNLEEVKSFVGKKRIIEIDLDDNEQNFPFFITYVPKKRVGSGMIDLLKVTSCLQDARDFPLLSMQVLFGGSAVFATTPLVPYPLLYEHDADNNKYHDKDQRFRDHHQSAVNLLTSDLDKRCAKWLLIPPQGLRLAFNVKNVEAPEGRPQKWGRNFRKSYNAGKALGEVQALFFPVYWLLGVVDSKEEIDSTKHAEIDEMQEALKGMNL